MRLKSVCAGAVMTVMFANAVLPVAALAQSSPKPSFTASPNSAGLNTPITFTLRLPSASSQPAAYVFNFGDGVTQTVFSAPVYGAAGFSATVAATHAYAKSGSFTAHVSLAAIAAETPTYSAVVDITGPLPTARPTGPPATARPSATPTAAPTAVATKQPVPMPTPTPSKTPTPHPTPSAPIVFSTPSASPTAGSVGVVAGVRPATIRAVTLTWPNGARDVSVDSGAVVPHPVAHVEATQGRYTLQWIVDGTLFATVVRDGTGSDQTIDLNDPLPINATGKPHRVEIVVVPRADPFSTPPPAQQISYVVATVPTASAAPYSGEQPVPKATMFSTAGLIVGKLLLRAPAWGRYEGDSGYASRERIGADAGVPVLNDAVRFAWRERNPGTAEDFVIHFYAGNREIASRHVAARTFLPDSEFIANALHEAGGPTADVRAKRSADQQAGKTSLADADITWQVEGLHAFAGAPAPIVVERSDRWPLAVPDQTTVAKACPAHANMIALPGRPAPNFHLKSQGNVASFSGTVSFADLPYAPDDVVFNGTGTAKSGPAHVRVFNNLIVDWGDGTLEPLSGSAPGSGSGTQNEPIKVGSEHVYASGGMQDIRVFALASDTAERNDRDLHDAEQHAFPFYCGSVTTVGTDLNILAVGIESPLAKTAGTGKFRYAQTMVIPAAATKCATAMQLDADISYVGDGDVDVAWQQNGVSSAISTIHLSSANNSDAQHPSVLRILSPPMNFADGSNAITVSITNANNHKMRGDNLSLPAGNATSSVCNLSFPTTGGSFVIDHVVAGYADEKARAEGRLSGTGTLEFLISDLAGSEIDLPTPITFLNWKVDSATGIVHDGILHATPGTKPPAGGTAIPPSIAAALGSHGPSIGWQLVPPPQTMHGLTWNVNSIDSKLVNDVVDDMHAGVRLTPASGGATLSAPWPTFEGTVDSHGAYTAVASNPMTHVDLHNGWSFEGGPGLNVDSSRQIASGFCAGFQPLITTPKIVPDAFMQAVGVTFQPAVAYFGDDGFCAQASSSGNAANLPNGSVSVGAFHVTFKDGVVHATDVPITSTVTLPGMQTALNPTAYVYEVDSGAEQAGIYGKWRPSLCYTEICPSTFTNGTTLHGAVPYAGANFSVGNMAYVAAPNPSGGGFVPALYGDFNESVSRYASAENVDPPDLRADIGFGASTVGIGAAFISFANNVPYETVTPQSTNVYTQTKIPSMGLSGFVQRDGSNIITQLQGYRPGDTSSQPVTYAWEIDNYTTLIGPSISVPDTEVALPAGQPRVHAVLKLSAAKEGSTPGNSGSQGWCGAADFSMMTSDEVQGVFYYGDGNSWLVAASVNLDSQGPEIIPGVAVLKGVGGGAGRGMDPSAFKGAVSQLAGKNTIEAPCSVAFPLQSNAATIDAHAQVGDAAGVLYTVDGDLKGSYGGDGGFVVELDAGAYILKKHPFSLDEDHSGADVQAQLKFANDALTGNITGKVDAVPDLVSINGTIVLNLGNGTYDINAPQIGVTIWKFLEANGNFDLNPSAISAGALIHFGDKIGEGRFKADYYFDVSANASIVVNPALEMTLDAGLDVGGDLCVLLCVGLSAGGGIDIAGPNPFRASVYVDLPDPFGRVTI